MSYFKKANDFYNAKEYEKAITMYEKALKTNENESSSLYNTAVCHIKLKNYYKAIDFLKNAINFKKDSKYVFNLAYCYAMLNNNQKALYYFNLSWSINNEDKDCEKAIKLILENYRN
ncbi:CDC27 family protein [Hathewaya histolytica]|uniref:TPR repeats containing protein n=1 Tax=Hathewaya histolytica TaxID=1498 RepID=A0A4U9RP29_HATHI|nr:CDC27 family protein [Hathewaya histolytica]VTQ93201.1 TPR repeats containing protein [Hathewaya histolytica]